MIHWVALRRQRTDQPELYLTERRKPLTPAADSTPPPPFAPAYLQRCRAARRDLSALWTPAVGDWVLQADDVCLLSEEQAAQGGKLTTGRSVCWVPRLDQLLALLTAVSSHTVLDCYQGDFACICFDEMSRRIADVVSETPELACLQANLFIRAELAAQESQQD